MNGCGLLPPCSGLAEEKALPRKWPEGATELLAEVGMFMKDSVLVDLHCYNKEPRRLGNW